LAEFEAALAAAAKAVEAELERVLPKPSEGPEGRLFEAMRYATMAGGKRLRPFMVIAGADIFEVPTSQSARAGAAVELIHTYSLIHDDLPCMDDDVMRRGKPTVHVAFDEATAVLAGDALLTLAFEVLAEEATTHDPLVRAQLVLGLARAAGGHGMVGGQMLDLLAENKQMDETSIIRMQRLKTGEMIAFSGEAGAILARTGSHDRQALRMFAHDLGLAFQITDDLLDVTGESARLGKTAGKDAEQGKATFVAMLGIEGAKERAEMLSRQAVAHLEIFGERADALRALAEFVISRRS
jgi:farnesyl diphosphate synthase